MIIYIYIYIRILSILTHTHGEREECFLKKFIVVYIQKDLTLGHTVQTLNMIIYLVPLVHESNLSRFLKSFFFFFLNPVTTTQVRYN